MSETTVIVRVEDLINMAFGPAKNQIVNFKLLRNILFILARQMRVLEQRVEMRVDESKRDEAQRGTKRKHRAGEAGPAPAPEPPRKNTRQGTSTNNEVDLAKSTTVAYQVATRGTSVQKRAAASVTRTASVTRGASVTRTASVTHGASIPVVTKQQFDALEAQVRALEARAPPPAKPLAEPPAETPAEAPAETPAETPEEAPAETPAETPAEAPAETPAEAPAPALASRQALTSADQANTKQLNARLSAAEAQLRRLTAHVTELVGAEQVTDARSRSAAPPASTTRVGPPKSISVISCGKSTASLASAREFVTRADLVKALQAARHKMEVAIAAAGERIGAVASAAQNRATAVADQVTTAMAVGRRVAKLKLTVRGHAEHLASFDVGLLVEMADMRDKIANLRSELDQGLEVMRRHTQESIEDNALTALREHCYIMRTEGRSVDERNETLLRYYRDLRADLQILTDRVGQLNEAKADHDEMVDAMHDKVEAWQVQGLVEEETFTSAIESFDQRLHMCYEKFHRQDSVWIELLKDMHQGLEVKATLVELRAWRDDAADALRETLAQMQVLRDAIGEPQAAVMARALSRNAACGSCATPAHASERIAPPIRLPALRPPPPTDLPTVVEEPVCCLRAMQPTPAPPKEKKLHVCQRWVGGSHTLLAMTRARPAPPPPPAPVFQRYTALGTDEKLYLMSRPYIACNDCNRPADGEGGGDRVSVLRGQRLDSRGACHVTVTDDVQSEQYEKSPSVRGDSVFAELRRTMGHDNQVRMNSMTGTTDDKAPSYAPRSLGLPQLRPLNPLSEMPRAPPYNPIKE